MGGKCGEVREGEGEVVEGGVRNVEGDGWEEVVPPAAEASLAEWVNAARRDAIVAEWMTILHVSILRGVETPESAKARFVGVEPELYAIWQRVFDAVFEGQVAHDPNDVQRELWWVTRDEPRRRDVGVAVQGFIDQQVLSEAVASRFGCTVVRCLEVDDGSLMVTVTFTPKVGSGSSLAAEELRDLDSVVDRYMPSFEAVLRDIGIEVISRRQGDVDFTIPARLISRS